LSDSLKMKLLQRGAEADLFLGFWHGLRVVRKIRVNKSYRIPVLDLALRQTRTVHEALIMHEAKKAGVPTPFIYMVDLEATEIVMEYIEGIRLREFLEGATSEMRIRLCTVLGEEIGKLHNYNIVHGDLTTSNAIVVGRVRLVLVDFGLSEFSQELEKRGVDILLGQRVFQSTHHSYGVECYHALLEGYRNEVGSSLAEQVEARVKEIARRGRYAIER